MATCGMEGNQNGLRLVVGWLTFSALVGRTAPRLPLKPCARAPLIYLATRTGAPAPLCGSGGSEPRVER